MNDIETICANSYRNFHVRGFDYLCLSRTLELTRKVYFFDGDLAHLPELVIPHNHRYAFVTTVMAGAVRNRTYFSIGDGDGARLSKYMFHSSRYDRFSYRTPLNGGDGFTWEREEFLVEEGRSRVFTRGDYYRSRADQIHTLNIRCEGTVLLLEQFADELPIDVPTQAWRRVGSRVPPSLDGLYDRMTPDHARHRIEQFLNLVGNAYGVPTSW
ncbi:hypothetical protein [Sphingobium lignivorans]|uniref:Uncharacterized protein n=1 Tax=Sphingobium lignivorans TaxID=2735886 RepID=A0ABR6NFC1_9SPHN|nr:hypothetical protein [Sphingobium lignivorans]MBB5985983.1 hypothetical protein [Sphingobium lignivorans]